MEDAADDGVESFDPGAGDAVLTEVEDLLFGFDEPVGKAFEFGDASFDRHVDPTGEPFVGALAVSVGPDLFESILEEVGRREITIGGEQEIELLAPGSAEVLGVAQQVITLALDERAAFGIRLRLCGGGSCR